MRSRILRISSCRVSSAEHLADALLHVDRLDELGLLLDGRVEVRGHEIGERARLLDGVDERARLARAAPA
jgi:hypothetical protein